MVDADAGRLDISVYADGRVIWRQIGGLGFRETGWLERRLTPEGVALVRAEVLATGLVDHDLNLTTEGHIFGGYIDFRTADRRVVVTSGENPVLLADVGPHVHRTKPTAEQARAFKRLRARLSDLAAWLPASAWVDAEDKPFVPSGYTVCYGGAVGVGLSRLFEFLPPPAASLLRAQEKTPQPYWNRPGTVAHWCSDLTNDEARTLERILDEAGVSGVKSVYGLEYGVFDVALAAPTEFRVGFVANLPDDERR
jgi:hypothetical protein